VTFSRFETLVRKFEKGESFEGTISPDIVSRFCLYLDNSEYKSVVIYNDPVKGLMIRVGIES
jgi:hypothetical protein